MSKHEHVQLNPDINKYMPGSISDYNNSSSSPLLKKDEDKLNKIPIKYLFDNNYRTFGYGFGQKKN
jgi:hypothetical protein